jgi:hypothetical protein
MATLGFLTGVVGASFSGGLYLGTFEDNRRPVEFLFAMLLWPAAIPLMVGWWLAMKLK